MRGFDVPRLTRTGATLLEVVVGGFLLVLLSVPIFEMLSGSSKSIKRTDVRREARFLFDRILERVESSDFLVLYQNFGIEPAAPQRIADGLWAPGRNPLLLDEELRNRVTELGWRPRLTFRFMTRAEVGEDPENPKRTSTGILHLQGAFLALRVESPTQPVQEVSKPIYCPLILGRPGLMVSQCPALNMGLKEGMFASIP